jgi:hypothetical protein
MRMRKIKQIQHHSFFSVVRKMKKKKNCTQCLIDSLNIIIHSLKTLVKLLLWIKILHSSTGKQFLIGNIKHLFVQERPRVPSTIHQFTNSGCFTS